MAEIQTESKPSTNAKSVRPAILLSDETLLCNAELVSPFLVALVEELSTPTVICTADCATNAIPSPPVNIIDHHRCRIPILKSFNINTLTEKLARYRPTVLHCIGRSKANLTRRLARKLSLPYVLMIEDASTPIQKYDICQNHCAAILTPTAESTSKMQKKYPQFADLIKTIRIGIFVADTCACFQSLSQTPGIVIAHPLQNAADFIPVLRAMKHLAIEGTEFMLVIIGQGPAKLQLQKTAASMGLLQFLSIVEQTYSTRTLFAGTDILILPHPCSTFNTNLLKAMSVGVAVATCKDQTNELLIENQTFVTFDPNDELSIYATVQNLLNKREFARKIALDAQSLLRKDHTVSKMANEMMQIYTCAQQWKK